MTATRLFLSALSLGLMLGLAGCASPLERRLVNNPQLYTQLTNNDKLLVNTGRIREGMTREAVFLSWGRADRVAAGRENGRSVEKWTYLGTQPVYTSSIGIGLGFGPGYGRFGRGYCGAWDPFWGGFGPTVAYVPYQAASVEFRNGRVVNYMNGPH